MTNRLNLIAVLALIACDTEPVAEAPSFTPLTPVQVLTRASLDLRGVRPTEAELDQVEADPAALESVIDGYLSDPRFEARVRDLFAEVYLTRTEAYTVNLSDLGLSDYNAFVSAVGEEPLRIVGHVAAQDLPVTELVTGDWTMANGVLAEAFPVTVEGSQWQQTRYTDGRPAAGILATNSMWWRFGSTFSNANRKRANLISRMFLCNDYLTRPIAFDREVDLLDESAVLEAIKTNPSCVNCHVSLDPIASALFGFFYFDETNPADALFYNPERELEWRDATGVAPAWYGTPISGLAELGQSIAADPRFPQCLTQQVYEGLLRRRMDYTLDADALTRHREALITEGLTLRALFRSVVDDPRYRGEAPPEAGGVMRKMVTPELLTSQIAELTGYRWTMGGMDMFATDGAGLKTLAGGIPGDGGTRSATSPSPTIVLTQERLSQNAASYAVQQAASGAPSPLFSADLTVHIDDDPQAAIAQVQRLHRLLFGTSPAADAPEVTEVLALWRDVYGVEGDPRMAWAGVLSALLRDPDLLFY